MAQAVIAIRCYSTPSHSCANETSMAIAIEIWFN